MKTTRDIATKTIREMKEFLLKKYEIDVSLGSIINLKPFLHPNCHRARERMLSV